MVVKLTFEPEVEKYFLPDSYGYRPNKSALDAVGITRQRCWKYNWVFEFDIKGLFDNIPHDLLMKAVCQHTQNKWVQLYIRRWLKAPTQKAEGEIAKRACGTPQGGVISPLLSNLFLHYAFDVWMVRNYSVLPWCRYADDGLVHCRTKVEAFNIKRALEVRFRECGLEMHLEKSKIVYCKDGARRENYENIEFDFLGYTYRRRKCKNTKRNTIFINFTPAVSKTALNSMRRTTRRSNLRNRTDLELEQIANWFNPKLLGWINYYGRYSRSALYPLLRHFNKSLVAWAMRKYRRFRQRKT